MLDLEYKKSELIIKDSEKKEVSFDISSKVVLLDWYNITSSWEYEKSWILVEVKKYKENLFYNFLIDKKRLIIISDDNFELKEEILSFFWDVDVLIITWTKKSAKIFENIEAKIVVPYWEWKEIFLNTLWQHIEEVKKYKIKWDFSLDTTEFVNLV